MKINGKKIEGLNIETIVIPRGNGETIVLKAQALSDYKEFEALCPEPKAKTILKKGGVKELDVNAPNYQTSMAQWAERRIAFMVIKSLSATEDLEWETVNLDDPNTWTNYRKELEASGFSDAEQVRIIQGVMAAQGLNEEKVKAARESFLAGEQEESQQKSSQEEELLSTQSS